MKEALKKILQIAAVFIGTVVGAGLASGQEITQFFTTYGAKSFIGIIICCIVYVTMCPIISSISIKYNLNSYDQLITKVSPGYFGKATDLTTGFFLISSSAIILAGSGALLHQYFNIPRYVGIILMCVISLYTLMKDTEGLVIINSFIVPALICTLLLIFCLYLTFFREYISLEKIMLMKTYKVEIIPYQWFLSALLYAGFNILCSSGVLVPLSKEVKSRAHMINGILLGSIMLTILSLIINLMLSLNIPSIFKYDIPLLYIAKPFGNIIQGILLCVIWCEMFSTEVSNIYSVAKTIEQKHGLGYKKAAFIIMAIAIPISQIGFKNLIKVLYPGFGAISLIFIIQCTFFYFKDK
ncbi:transporter [Hathewaya histolytica]|uniref:Membrane protein n=1 Tax=Hathewaya histolytica TaxID=1498 RepID=A0A4V6KEN0_HATHI|nr:transporter [Hathewaya histolytica]VTQ95517.1 membrane protein [Hathewaya histolytica]